MAKKKQTIVGNMLIAQSGGPTAVINQSLVGAVLQAKKHKEIKKSMARCTAFKEFWMKI